VTDVERKVTGALSSMGEIYSPRWLSIQQGIPDSSQARHADVS
jgi:hypothetical protein